MADKNKLEVVLSLMDQATAPLQAFNKRIEKMQEPVRKVSNKLAIFGQAAGLGKLGGAVKNVGESFGNVVDKAGDLAKKVTGAAAVAGGAIFGLVKMTSNAGDAFDELSIKSGVSAEFFQKAAYAASFASIGQDELAGSLAKMNANMVAANMGGKEMQKWFLRAGISAQELKKMKPEDAFNRVIEAVGKLPKDSAKAGALMRAIFGKSGADLLPMVDGFKELSEEAEKLGLVLSNDVVKQGAEFNDSFDKMVKVIKGVGMMIGSMLMPYVKEIVTSLTEWVLANREIIKSNVAAWIAKLKDNWPAIQQGAMDAWEAMKKIVAFISGAIDTVGGFGNALIIVAAIMAGPLLLALVSLGSELVTLGGVIMATPFGWVIAGVVAVAAAIYAFWGPLTKVVGAIWDGIAWVFKQLFGGIMAHINMVRSALSALIDFGKSVLGFGGDSTVTIKKGQDTGAAEVAPGAAAGVAGVASAAEVQRSDRTTTNNASVSVDFKNVPRGTEVTPGANNKAPLDYSMGYTGAW